MRSKLSLADFGVAVLHGEREGKEHLHGMVGMDGWMDYTRSEVVLLCRRRISLMLNTHMKFPSLNSRDCGLAKRVIAHIKKLLLPYCSLLIIQTISMNQSGSTHSQSLNF